MTYKYTTLDFVLGYIILLITLLILGLAIKSKHVSDIINLNRDNMITESVKFLCLTQLLMITLNRSEMTTVYCDPNKLQSVENWSGNNRCDEMTDIEKKMVDCDWTRELESCSYVLSIITVLIVLWILD
jgi:hypothetical protein